MQVELYLEKSKNSIPEAERQLIAISENRSKDGGLSDINPILKNTVEQIESMVANQGQLSGLSSGFKDDLTPLLVPG